MKKLLRGIWLSSLALILLLAFFCVGIVERNKNVNSASAAIQKYVVNLDYANAFRTEKLQFVYDGVTVEYQFKEEYVDGDWVYKMTAPTGVTSVITEVSSSAEIGDGETYYYCDEEAASSLEAKFASIDSIYTLPFAIPVDAGSKINFVLSAKNSTTFEYSYFNSVDYKISNFEASKYNIVKPQVEPDGSITLEGTYNEERGLYERTVNDWPFAYNFNEEYGFKFEIGRVDSSITIDFSSTSKSYPIVIKGDGATDGTIEIEYTEYISFSNLAQADFKPINGKIINKLDLYIGKEIEENKLFTLYGGMCGEHLDLDGGTITDYYFNGDFTLDTETTPIAVYGNFALAIESHIESENNYTFKSPEETGGNYSELSVEPHDGEDLTNEESYSIRLYANGRVSVSTRSATAGLIFVVSSQSFAQVDVMLVNNDGTRNATSKALESLKVGETLYENIKDGENYVSTIPKSVFAVGYSGTLEIRATVISDKFNYAEIMGTEGIEGSLYVTTIECGILTIYTEEKDTYFFEINLKLPEGGYYEDSSTEIFISSRSDFSEGDGFINSEYSMTSTNGFAVMRSIMKGTVIKFKIKVSPYRLIVAPDESVSVLEYVEYDYVVTENTTLVFTMEKFAIEKPVYYGGEIVGHVKIRLLSVYQDNLGSDLISNAGYEVLFKGVHEEEYTPLTASHPSKYGYDFINLKMVGVSESRSFLVEYLDNTYVVGNMDYSIHNYLASTVFFAETDGGGRIEADFNPKLINIRFVYPEHGTTFRGLIYFDSDLLYLDRELIASEIGKYFAGLRYTYGDGTISEIYRNETDLPVLVEDGEFAGMYRYKMRDSWICAENNVPIEVLTDFATFEFTVVFTNEDGTTNVITEFITYSTEFTIESLNLSYGYDEPKYPGIGTFNHIGWQIEDVENFVVADECDFVLGRPLSYQWTKDVRMVPVFSANTIVVSFYDGEDFINSAPVAAGEKVDLKKLLFIDDWVVLNEYGSVFEGFACNGRLAIDYVAEPNYYELLGEGNEEVFVDVDGEFYWIGSNNVVFNSSYTKINYKILLELTNSEYVEPTNWTSNFGSWIEFENDKFHLDGFTIDDTLILGGFTPINEDAFVSLIKFGYSKDGETEFLDPEFFAVCDANGVVNSIISGTRFNTENYTMSLIVNEFINSVTEADTIRIHIEYLPVTYIISFTANIYDELGEILLDDASSTSYYKLTKENARISRADYWMLCDETGENILGMGWQPIVTPNNGLTFTKSSLGGISGLSLSAPNGKTYSFKFWMDMTQGITLGSDTILNSNYNFCSIFSDVFDVAVNYHTYSSYTSTYELNSVEGYFWNYEEEAGVYSVGETKAANAYEIYLIDGELYYIVGWSTVVPSSLNTVFGADDICLNEAYEVSYSIDAQTLNFYAVYEKYKFIVVKTESNFEVEIGLPNDPNGNSYSKEDVKFVKVLKAQFDSDAYEKFNIVDKLNAILSSASLLANATIGEGGVLNSPVVESEYYVFAVVQRKVDGINIMAFYIAMQLPINESI